MAKHMVRASGLNIFPSICSRVKSGKKTMTMMRMAMAAAISLIIIRT